MVLWQDFLDSLDTGGGHLLLLSVFAIVFACFGNLEKYEGELIGALLMGLKVAGSNKTRRDRPIPITTVTATTAKTETTAAAGTTEMAGSSDMVADAKQTVADAQETVADLKETVADVKEIT